MTAALGSSLRGAIDALSEPGILIGCREISEGDERALMPPEEPAFASSVMKVRRASGAARIVARELLAQIGIVGCALPKSETGAPVWPAGVVGSLSHDPRVAVAAIAKRRDFAALGIDVEPAEALPSEIVDMVVRPEERAEIGDDLRRARLLFAAKEAVYKAVHPLDREFLDHHDVEVSVAHRQATVRNGRRLELRFSISDHLLVLAFLRAGHV